MQISVVSVYWPSEAALCVCFFWDHLSVLVSHCLVLRLMLIIHLPVLFLICLLRWSPPMLDLCYFSCACPSSPRRQYRGAHPDSTGGEETAHQPPAPAGRGPRYDAYMTRPHNKPRHSTCVTHKHAAAL